MFLVLIKQDLILDRWRLYAIVFIFIDFPVVDNMYMYKAYRMMSSFLCDHCSFLSLYSVAYLQLPLPLSPHPNLISLSLYFKKYFLLELCNFIHNNLPTLGWHVLSSLNVLKLYQIIWYVEMFFFKVNYSL